MKKIKLCILLTGILFSFVMVPSQSLLAQASGSNCPVDLEFNQEGILPSTQGLTYISNPSDVLESSIFSVSGGALHLNSLGTGAAAYYILPSAYDPSQDFILEFRMKVYPGTSVFGIDFNVSDAVNDFEVGFADNGIYLPPPPNSRPFLTFNTSDDFHVYKLSSLAGTATYQLFVDNVLIASNIVSGGDPNNSFFFGDGSLSGGDGQADIDYVRYCQSDPNQPPTVDAGGPYNVSEGGSVVVTAFGNDPDSDALTFAWDLDNNGSFETPGQSATFGALGLHALDSRTITVQATDSHGLSATDHATINIIYNFNGFFPPVDNLPVVNVAKAGSAIPVKFSLGGNRGLAILTAGYPISQKVACDTSAPLSDIEQTVTANSSGLTYDATSSQYIYVWKTDKAWAGTCRQLVVRLADSTEHKASFRFK